MLSLLLGIILVGVVLYFVEAYIPMSPPISTLLRIVVVLFVIFWLVQIFGLNVPLPHLR